MNKVVQLKPMRSAPKAVRSEMDTKIFSLEEVEGWKRPPFQRPIRVNDKVRAMAEDLAHNGGVLSGVLTLGRLGEDRSLWVVDGQHRIEGFKISGLKEIIADVRVCHFDTLAEMADEFVSLNSQLVRMRPDDVLRGLEASTPALQRIRKDCEFVGYDQIRRGSGGSTVLSMSMVLRCWAASANETPAAGTQSASHLATSITEESVQTLIIFLLAAQAAWGRDIEYQRLWGSLNLTICMWLFRRIVIDRDRSGNKRAVVIGIALFKQCLMSLSASVEYIDWLVGRQLSERHRGVCYAKIKDIFARRIMDESRDKTRPKMPQAAWVTQ